MSVPAGTGAAILDALFASIGISFERIDHPAVYTANDAERLVPPARGAHAKNLLVQDGREGRLYMVTVPFGKRTDLAATARCLGTGKLRFASEGTMQDVLGITPGAVSVLALVNDTGRRVTLVLDQVLAEATAVQCHPLVNTATLVIESADLRRFLAATGHEPVVFVVPEAAPS